MVNVYMNTLPVYSRRCVFPTLYKLLGFTSARPLHSTQFQMAADTTENMEGYKSQGKSAFVLGYTGEVGKALVQALNEHKIFKKVVLIGRREVPLDVGPEFEQKVIDYEKIGVHKDIFQGLDAGFCCLGTTHGKAGTQGFIRVDRDYVLMSAEVAKAQGCEHFSLVSSMGANANSCFLYPRTKGEAENGLKDMKLDRLSIYRPAMLMCDRVERRPGEAIIRACLKPLMFCCPTYGTVPVEVVAMAMINNAVTPAKDSAVEVYDNRAIHRLAETSKGCSANQDGSKRKDKSV